ncbi:gamma-glutamyltransferase family protein [Ancylobacter radicis]|uniref:Gamma-glutamyltransferase family protein n=1 Tax=Ancylobacter radicis TaxID=2836179 RepID=A0ABS5R7V5_9HYPH|nr:gamma-glutamyltransferase family protein [Ancylobacter radicis]MBS9476971.1 gamma-glutamyltransferase family protein [Ancylobacter radicis]
MLNTVRARRGMVTSPHHLASEAGLRVLREGGNAVEATIAMAAALAVVYPHMTAIGGDGFWLIGAPGEQPVGIEACGRAASTATPALYAQAGHASIPQRGPLAANTVAATVAGWGEALALSAERGGRMPLARLIEDAAWHAENGFPVTLSQHALTAEKMSELVGAPGFADAFLVGGAAPATGSVMRLPALGQTLRRLGREGTESFYRGAIARDIAADLAQAGTPVSAADLAACTARRVAPLSVRLGAPFPGMTLYNFPPPTQGLASLMILALFARLGVTQGEGFAHLHGLVEATKQAFLVRDRVVGDPEAMNEDPRAFLADDVLDRLAARIDPARALPWPAPPSAGDTVWLGAIDGNGLAASFIQSIYFEFGSGVVLPQTGIVWQNRGSSFQLSGEGPRVLAPGRKPFHTLNPAMASFDDGRHMVYGTMGGEGQPQTQAALFSRYALFGQDLQQAITAPRWLLGRTWGAETVTLKLEDRFPPALIDALRAAGHEVERVGAHDPMMGHAGAIARHADGRLEGASDPRSDGAAYGF